MNKQKAKIDASNPVRDWRLKLCGTAALMLGMIFLIGLIGVIQEVFYPGAGGEPLTEGGDNWLVVLFKLNAGFEGAHFDLLRGVNGLDVTILLLLAVALVGLYILFQQKSRILALIAMILPVLGIGVLIATQLAGRSAVMAAVLLASIVMLRSTLFNKATAVMGILASVLLLTADFGTKPDFPSILMAVFVGIGYVLIMTWFLLVGIEAAPA